MILYDILKFRQTASNTVFFCSLNSLLQHTAQQYCRNGAIPNELYISTKASCGKTVVPV